GVARLPGVGGADEQVRRRVGEAHASSGLREPTTGDQRDALRDRDYAVRLLALELLDERPERLEAQAGAERLQRQHLARLDVAQPHVRAEAQDEILLLVLQRG